MNKLQDIAVSEATVWAVAATRIVAADETVTITGEGKCAKCTLKETKECQNVIQSEKDGKKVTYYLVDNDVSKKFHGKLCSETKKLKATGTVKDEYGKMQLTDSKIEPAE